MTAHNAKTSRLHVSGALATAQPWVRDHYATLRAEAGPRWEHAKTVVVPVVADTTTRVREDYLPAAAHASSRISSRLASSAAERSAPYRAELASRGMAALAAALIGAATGAGVVLWQRSRYKSWDQEELVHSVLDEPTTTGHTGTDETQDDPADPDGGAADASHAGSRNGLHSS